MCRLLGRAPLALHMYACCSAALLLLLPFSTRAMCSICSALPCTQYFAALLLQQLSRDVLESRGCMRCDCEKLWT